jgi:hypothetical protein
LADVISDDELRGALAALDPKPEAGHTPSEAVARAGVVAGPAARKGGGIRIPREEWLRRRKAVSESRCPVNCTLHGTCNEELGRWGWEGG